MYLLFVCLIYIQIHASFQQPIPPQTCMSNNDEHLVQRVMAEIRVVVQNILGQATSEIDMLKRELEVLKAKLKDTSGINLAAGKPATQSATHISYTGNYTADRANNGNHITKAIGPGDSCAHTGAVTNDTPSPWWQVDLLYNYSVGRVSILAREDDFVNETANILVEVGNTSDGTFQECDRSTDGWLGTFRDYICSPSPIVGRFVRVSRWKDNEWPLTLCEVEVYAA